LESEEAFLQAIWKGVTPRTRVIFFSHLTSPTAQLFPVREVCLRAREMGILTVVDGAHAPGHIPLNLSDLDPDYYIGNCHKWLSAPKGSAFVYTRRRLQTELDPLVVSWGWGEDPPWATGSAYLDNLQWSGTLDPSAYLSVPAAIRFQEANDWPSVQTACHALLTQSLERIEGITGLPSVYASLSRSQQMAITALPPLPDPPAFKAKLSDRYRIEVPIIQWGGGPYLRVSVGGYNSQEDIDALVTALEDLLG
jgi:isopenicillin-N epimerase